MSCLNGLKFDGFWKKGLGLKLKKSGDHLDNPFYKPYKAA